MSFDPALPWALNNTHAQCDGAKMKGSGEPDHSRAALGLADLLRTTSVWCSQEKHVCCVSAAVLLLWNRYRNYSKYLCLWHIRQFHRLFGQSTFSLSHPEEQHGFQQAVWLLSPDNLGGALKSKTRPSHIDITLYRTLNAAAAGPRFTGLSMQNHFSWLTTSLVSTSPSCLGTTEHWSSVYPN